MTPRPLRCGDRAVLLEFDDLAAVMAHYAALTFRPHPDVVDVVPAARTILVTARTPEALPAVRAMALAARPRQAADRGADVVHLEVRYDGPDLEPAAAALGTTPDALVHRHTAEHWTVAFCGFAPGFGYLAGRRFTWSVPRRPDPRARVPAGAVGLAGEFSGVYPRSSPGGWQLIGRTAENLFDLDRDPPALLRPGTPVRFHDAEDPR